LENSKYFYFFIFDPFPNQFIFLSKNYVYLHFPHPQQIPEDIQC
jgi:hypothetical protein